MNTKCPYNNPSTHLFKTDKYSTNSPSSLKNKYRRNHNNLKCLFQSAMVVLQCQSFLTQNKIPCPWSISFWPLTPSTWCSQTTFMNRPLQKRERTGKDQLNLRVFATNRSIWRRKMATEMVALQISPKIESLNGLGRQATKRFLWNFATFARLPFGRFSAENS